VPASDPNSDWLTGAKRALEPYFTGLNDPATLIVEIGRTVRLYDDDAEKVAWAGTLMAAAAAGEQPKRAPLTARLEGDGTYTILDGKSTHANLERLGLPAVPLVVEQSA
jgi:hypothetical protein